MPRVLKIVRTVEQLRSVERAWRELQSNPNIDWEFYHLILSSRREIEAPFVICIEEDNEVVGLVVARVQKQTISLRIGYKTCGAIDVRCITIPAGGFLGNFSSAGLTAVIQALESEITDGEIQMVLFSGLRDDALGEKLAGIVNSRFLAGGFGERRRHWMMTLPPPKESILKRLSRKHRYWIKRLCSKLDLAFPNAVEYMRYSRPDEVEAVCDAAEAIAVRTYQRGLGAGFRNDQETRTRFKNDAHLGRLHAYILHLGGRPAAFWFTTSYSSTCYSVCTGYLPEMREWEIGSILFVYMVDDLAKRGYAELDFGSGDALYKQRFGDRSWWDFSLAMYGPQPKAIVAKALSDLSSISTRFGKWFLDEIGVLRKLKKLWRRSLSVAVQDAPLTRELE